MVNVPSQYQPLVSQMSQATGIPQDVIAAQANDESGFSATARSSAGALGWLQFLPSTYDSNAAQAGVSPGTEFNPADEAKVYDVYMSGLLKQERGNLRNALAAYNAGPGNLAAGYGYADHILQEAGNGTNNIQTTGFNPLNPLGSAAGGVVQSAVNGLLSMLGLGSLKDMFERLGLVLLGAALIFLGIHILSGGSGQSINVQPAAAPEPAPERKAGSNAKTKSASKEAATATEKTGASSAIEAAAVA